MLPSCVEGTECEMLNMLSSSLRQTQEVSLINCIANFSNHKTSAIFMVYLHELYTDNKYLKVI